MPITHRKNSGRQFILLALVLLLSACSSMLASTANKMAENLSRTILNSDDPQTVADGAPAYLLLMDSFILESPDNIDLLQSGAKLYSAYAGIFVSNPDRAALMSSKAMAYAEKALCLENQTLCSVREQTFKDFSRQVNQISDHNFNSWAIFGTTWAGWIKANSFNMAAIAEIPKVTLIMQHIAQQNENWENGIAHLYLGVLNTLIPPALGGKPELGEEHFKRAIELSNNSNLMVKVLYAEKYARLVFDQALHDKLLNDVLQSDPYYNDLTLMNHLAKIKAQELLDSSVDYF